MGIYISIAENTLIFKTWGLQIYTFCHLSGCPVRAMSPLPLCSGPGKNYSFSTLYLYNPLPEHKG